MKQKYRYVLAGTVAACIFAGSGRGGSPVSPVLSACAEELPARFDWREEGKTPVVKSQGQRGTCWALTATSALEAVFLPDKRKVFSADHMSLNNGFVISQKEGGDYKMIMAYLSGWYGPVLEEEDPYGDDRTTDGLSAAVHVQQMILLEEKSRDTFKDMIYRCGPVQTSLYLDRRITAPSRSWYNSETCAFYYPEKEAVSHDVLLLGWDDDFPKENFLIDPGEDGAWICQNTWGESFGENGVFYVSYQDPNAASTGLAYCEVDEADNYDSIYQTDVCGWQGRIGYDSPECCFANIYTAGGEEMLCGAGFYSLSDRSGYEIYIVHDFSGPEDFLHKKLLTDGEVEGTGYFTVPFSGEELRENERFAVIVRITTPGIEKPVAVELKKDDFTGEVTTEGKESYISLSGGEWNNTQEMFGANVCLKAYTRRK